MTKPIEKSPAQDLLKQFLEEHDIALVPVIANAERTESGKVIISPGIQVSYVNREEPKEDKGA
jgi:hypothetical protein